MAIQPPSHTGLSLLRPPEAARDLLPSLHLYAPRASQTVRSRLSGRKGRAGQGLQDTG